MKNIDFLSSKRSITNLIDLPTLSILCYYSYFVRKIYNAFLNNMVTVLFGSYELTRWQAQEIVQLFFYQRKK